MRRYKWTMKLILFQFGIRCHQPTWDGSAAGCPWANGGRAGRPKSTQLKIRHERSRVVLI